MEKQDVIEFEISDRCSAALREIIRARGWRNQKSFTLLIRKGVILSLLEQLASQLMCEFHVGCVFDRRPPSFGYELSKEKNRGQLFFYYWRHLSLEIFAQSKWFRGQDGLRDLEEVALAMGDPQNYEETIGLGWTGPHEGLGHCSQVILRFKNGQWNEIERLRELQEAPLKLALSGFEGGILDLDRGPLSSEREKLLERQRFSADVLIEKGISAEEVIRELYRLFSLT